MNISSEIFSTQDSNSSHYIYSNDTEVKTEVEMSSVGYIISILMSFPTNSYVIWLIVTGTGNGLTAELLVLNLTVCEILLSVESLLLCFCNKFEVSRVGLGFFDGIICTGRSLFQCLICVERYLAVVHPVTFLKFKPLRYRLICSVIAWVTTFISGGFSAIIWFLWFNFSFIFWVAQLLVFLSVQLFCCVAVLRALKLSGPGERGRERQEENHMKRKAFYLILITTVTMVNIYVVFLILIFVPTGNYLYVTKICIIQLFYTLAGLVQPVLFLYRVGKLNFIKCQ